MNVDLKLSFALKEWRKICWNKRRIPAHVADQIIAKVLADEKYFSLIEKTANDYITQKEQKKQKELF